MISENNRFKTYSLSKLMAEGVRIGNREIEIHGL